jgi:hypothetical protein
MDRTLARRLTTVAGLAAAVAVAFTVGVARGTPACAQTLPAPLVTFCSGGPALAQEINANFLQTAAWMAAKMGRPGDKAFQVPDCIKYQVNGSASGGVAYAQITAGDSACGAGRYPTTVYCQTTTNGGVLDGMGLSTSGGTPYGYCRTHGAGAGSVSVYGSCCRMSP